MTELQRLLAENGDDGLSGLVVTTKVCSKCKKLKSLEAFGKHIIEPDGFRRECRECVASYNTKAHRQRRQQSPETLMLNAARYRAKNKRLPFNITLDDVVIPTHCPVLGIPLKRAVEGKIGRHSPSLDRIIPELGYVRGNVVVISHKANSIKQDATSEEIFKVATWLASLNVEPDSQTNQSAVCTEVLPNLTFTRHEVI